MALFDGIQGKWSLTESSGIRFDDSPNSNHLTDNSTAGAVGNSTGFDSTVASAASFVKANTQELIRADNPTLSFTGNFSVSFWFRRASNHNAGLVSKWDALTGAGDQKSYVIRIQTDDKVKFFVNSSTDVVSSVAHQTVIVVNTWYHVVARYDGANLKLIINNVNQVLLAYTGNIKDTTSNLELGGQNSRATNAALDGELSDVAVWNRAITDAEVTELFGLPEDFGVTLNIFNGAQGKWKLTESSGIRFDDSPNANDLTDNSVTGNVSNVVGHSGTLLTAASFVRVNNQELVITSNSSLSFSTEFSISFWFKRNITHNGGLVGKWNSLTGNASYIVRIQTDDKVKFFVSLDGATVGASIAHQTVTVAGTWYHVVARYDGTNIKLIVNNANEVSAAYSSGIKQGTAAFELGGQNNRQSNVAFDGSLSDVVVWNRSISNADIATLFAMVEDFGAASSLFSSVQGKWSLTESSGTRSDTSVNANNLTAIGAVGNSTGFDGTVTSAASFVRASNQELKIADTASLSFTSNFSISFWFRRASNHNGGLVGKWDITGNQRSYLVRIQTTDKVKFFVSTSGTAADASIEHATVIAVDTWYHVVARYDGTNIKLIVDNANEVTAAHAAGIFDSTSVFELGGQNNNTANVALDGELSDVAVWNRAITNAEVTELFALQEDFGSVSPLADAVAIWTLEETSGTRFDGTANNHDLSDNNTVGLDNGGALFIATNSEFLSLADQANPFKLDITGDITIYAKFKLNTIGVDQAILTKWNATGNQRAYAFRVRAANTLQFFISTDGLASANVIGTTVLTTGIIYQVFAVRSGSTVDIYVNNASVVSGTISGNMINTTAAVEMGSFNAGTTNFLDGVVYDCMVWDRALSSAERNNVLGFGSSFVLTDVPNYTIVQRNASNQGSLTISGFFPGSPTSIEARIVNDATTVEVVTWTVIDAAPAGGTFSGTLTSIPQGGWYNIQVRFSNDVTTFDNGTNKFGVGLLVAVIGQSQGTRMFSDEVSPPTPNLTTSMFTTSNIWAVPTGNGAISFLNTLNNSLNIPVGAIQAAVGASGLRQEAKPTSYWLNFAAAPYSTFLSRLTSAGGSVEYLFWTQGERDARSSVVTEAEYNSSLTAFFAQLRTDVSNPVGGGNIKIVANLLGRGTDVTDIDVHFQNIRNAQRAVLDLDVNAFVGSTSVGFALQDTIHYTPASYTVFGTRMAQTILDDLGNVTFHRGPQLSTINIISSTTYDVNMVHNSSGTDYTPVTGITGFELLNNGTPVALTSVVRQDAVTVRITTTSAPAGTVTVRYLYGADPAISSMVVDDTTLNLPLEDFDATALTFLFNTVTLTDVVNLKIIQRDSFNQGSLIVAGTYTGTPISIEARIVNDATTVEVVAWTVIDAALSGGTFSGTLPLIPQGGWYNVQVRTSDDISVVSNGTNKFGVGLLVVVIGQDQGTRFFSDETFPPTPNTTTSMFTTGDIWAVPTGNSAITFLNALSNSLSIPIGAIQAALIDSALRSEAVTGGVGYWSNFAAAPYSTFLSRLTSAGGSVEYIFWTQGERDALSNVVTEAEYNASLTAFFAQLRIDISNPVGAGNIKIIANLLGRGTVGVDADFQAIRNAQVAVLEADSAAFIGATAIDLGLIDTIHYTSLGYTKLGTRIAQTILDDLGVVTFHRGPQLSTMVSPSPGVFDVNITHNAAGTDFIPVSGIIGFEIFDDGVPLTISSATRKTATAIRLITSTSPTGVVTARYLYGANPNTAQRVQDNTTLVLPMEGFDSVTLQIVVNPAVPDNDVFHMGLYGVIMRNYIFTAKPLLESVWSQQSAVVNVWSAQKKIG